LKVSELKSLKLT